jgi:iron(III) transport system ATP-binding protein
MDAKHLHSPTTVLPLDSASQNTAADHGPSWLQLEGVTFAYPGGRSICRDFNFQVEHGEIACLLGPSGCGKTTVLRLVGGFERPATGSIRIGSRTLADDHQWTPPEARGVGYVFQDFALFPHLTVADNVAFGLRSAEARAHRNIRVAEMLDLVGMGNLGKRYPHELSGGQRQRIALARALAPAPDFLLMDEPFSNLDVDLREKLGLEVRSLLKHLGITALFVTHDQHEAFSIADKVSVMNAGHIEQTDSAYNLYHRPLTRFVADFVGQGVLIHGHGTGNGTIITDLGELHPTNLAAQEIRHGGHYDVLLRPDDVQHDDASPATATVMHKAFRGADILYTLKLFSGTKVLSLVPSHHNHELGQEIGIRLEIDHVVAFPAEAEHRLAAD